MVGPVLMTPSKMNPNPIPQQQQQQPPPTTIPNGTTDSSIDTNHNDSNTNITDELQVLAQTLNLDLDKLPQNIINNAAFAVNNIINDEQDNTADNDDKEQLKDEDKKGNDNEDDSKEEKKDNNTDETQTQSQLQSPSPNEEDIKGSPLIFPLAMSPELKDQEHQAIIKLI
eukprot:CAMPEP_0201594566 /NCGR_PEP_ID=MMETSP0190_2-20130828/191840_1 /ASSEMBLY_ACC=CAM_ASM_000263 /TAXON_ID=37353 /ORGANISM="Rosalina sp." /LENGTH=169 /DNA_ID=CAMNT_0048054227 /DNA_START=290 /DNA_END=800 /DNA_ORIENTATION=+